MVATPSRMIPLGTPAPDFELPEPLTGKTWTLDAFADADVLVVAFICNHCPYVVHLKEAIAALARETAPKGVAWVAISSNDAEAYPQDGPDAMADDARRFRYPFPYLYDSTQAVARAFGAACTPDFFVFDRDRRLTYRGQFDDTRPAHRTAPENEAKGAAPRGTDLRRAIAATREGKPIPPESQKPSLGCNIKWK